MNDTYQAKQAPALQHTEGLVAAPPTGFLDDGSIDLEVVQALAEHLNAQGVVGVFINGTTGESMSLAVEEREQLMLAWRRALPPGMKLFVHTTHHALPDAIRLTRHASLNGADAIGAMAPSFFKLKDVVALVDWCAAIAAAAPTLPFYYYHMPSMNGVTFRVFDFMQEAAERIPNLAGVKYTFESLGDYHLCNQLSEGRFEFLWGRDEMLLGALAMGAKGAVGSTYNIASGHFYEMIRAFNENDLATARHLQTQLNHMMRQMNAAGNFHVALKAILRHQGIPIGLSVRAPLSNVDESRLGNLTALDLLPPMPSLT